MDDGTICDDLADGSLRGVPRYERHTALTLDHANAICRRFYSEATMDVAPDDDTPFVMQTEVIRLGPLTVGQLTLLPGVLTTAPSIDGYHVSVPVTGDLHAVSGSTEVTGRPCRTAVVYRPDTPAKARHDGGTRQLDVKVDRRALEVELEGLLDRPVRGVIDLAPAMDLTTGPGRSWAQLVRLIREESRAGDGLLFHPLIAERLWHSVVSGLLLATTHRWHPAITDPVVTGPPRAIRRAIDAIEAEPHLPFTVRDLARVAGVSVRSLQEGFRRHLGTSPTAYLQQVRLAQSHAALQRADPQRVTVAAVAHRWGFAHLGRFARAYRSRYGVHPSTTLRRER